MVINPLINHAPRKDFLRSFKSGRAVSVFPAPCLAARGAPSNGPNILLWLVCVWLRREAQIVACFCGAGACQRFAACTGTCSAVM